MAAERLLAMPGIVVALAAALWGATRRPDTQGKLQPPLHFHEAFGPEVARKRWDQTLDWRRRQRVDGVLAEANDAFHAMKRHYPHSLHLPDRGGHVTYWEFPGRIDVGALRASGVTPAMAVRHYIWHAEYTWTVVLPKPGAKTTVVFDMDGLSWDHVNVELIQLLREVVGFTNAHYPNRAHRIIVVNTPAWIGTLTAIVRPLMNRMDHVVFLDREETRAGKLTEYIAPSNLPPEYGGRSKVRFGDSKYERAMRAYVTAHGGGDGTGGRGRKRWWGW